MNRTQIHQAILNRIQKLPETKATKEFLSDVQHLCDMNSDQSLPGINASVWLDTLYAMPDNKLEWYAMQYVKGRLDPFKG